MSLLLLPPRCATQRDAVIEGAVVADLGGLADDDAHAVVDKYPATDDRARMDLDPGEPPAPMRQPAGEPPQSPAPERMGDPAVPDQCVQPRVASQDLPSGPGGRVAVEDDRDVFAKSAEHSRARPRRPRDRRGRYRRTPSTRRKSPSLGKSRPSSGRRRPSSSLGADRRSPRRRARRARLQRE